MSSAHAPHGPKPPHAFFQHHYNTVEQQAGAAKLGMWAFLATEILMFSGLFLAYFITRMFYPEMVLSSHELLSKTMGGTNTVVLLTSSYTMAMAVRSAQVGNTPGIIRNLYLTIGCACIFMVVKYFEYTGKFAHGIFPGKYFDYARAAEYAHEHGHELIGLPHIFFGLYFCMTGLHGIHVLVGVFVFIWLLVRAIRGDFTPEYFGPIDYAALYWHLVDLIWIFLFPLLYLIH
jgi:cytochrome c oxidase subunit III